MINPFISVTVIPGYHKGHVVQWSVSPSFKDSLPHNFTIQITDDPLFKHIISEKSVGDNYFGVEDSMIIQTFNNDFLIRVKLTTGSATYYSDGIYLTVSLADRSKYLYAAEIMRKELLLYSRVGYKCKILKEKVFGPTDKSQLDPVSGVPIALNIVDGGSGLRGWYYAPAFETYFRIENLVEETALNQMGDGTNNSTTLQVSMPGVPLLAVKDFVVTMDDKRYLIDKIVSKYYPGTNIVIKQSCILNLLSNTDKIYQVEL